MANSAKLTLETVDDGLRFRVLAGSGKTSVVDSGPGMIAPSPIEALLVALAGCCAMDVISILRKQRQRVTAYEVSVRGERQTEHPRRFISIEIDHRLTGHDLDPVGIGHAIELSRTKYCSVTACLDPAIPLTNRFEIVAATDATPEPQEPA